MPRSREVINERFTIEQLAGFGGMGQVYRARDRVSGGLVALKVMHDAEKLEIDRFAREAQVLSTLSHPGIVRYIDSGFTARYLLQTLAGRGPNSIAICTLLDRTSRRIVQLPIAFRCFVIPDHFVIGFGLDYKQLYRNLGCIAVMNPDKA